jgi:hypothetical protein
MYLYFKDKDILLDALANSTDKNLIKKYGDEYRFDVKDLNAKERNKFFYPFCKKNQITPFRFDDDTKYESVLFGRSEYDCAFSIYEELLSKYRKREDVILFLCVYRTTYDYVRFYFESDNPDDHEYVHKTIHGCMATYYTFKYPLKVTPC